MSAIGTLEKIEIAEVLNEIVKRACLFEKPKATPPPTTTTTTTATTAYRKAKAEGRLSMVDGLLKAIIDIDKVIKIIRGSDDAAAAKEKLIKDFKLNDEQATYILDMPLRRLTKMSKLELESEQKELKTTIAALVALLKSDETIKAQVATELTAVGKAFATPRRTKILQ